MARETGPILDSGDPFAGLTMATTAGGTLTLPADGLGRWTILLVYRGHW